MGKIWYISYHTKNTLIRTNATTQFTSMPFTYAWLLCILSKCLTVCSIWVLTIKYLGEWKKSIMWICTILVLLKDSLFHSMAINVHNIGPEFTIKWLYLIALFKIHCSKIAYFKKIFNQKVYFLWMEYTMLIRIHLSKILKYGVMLYNCTFYIWTLPHKCTHKCGDQYEYYFSILL